MSYVRNTRGISIPYMIQRYFQGSHCCYYTRPIKQPTFAPGYSVILPEVPPLSKSDRQYTSKDFFDLMKISPLHIANAAMEALSLLEVRLNEAASLASDIHNRRNFDLVFKRLYAQINEMSRLNTQLSGIAGVLGNNHTVAYILCIDNLNELSTRHLRDMNLYLSSKEIIADNCDMDRDTMNILRHYNELGYFNGASLMGSESKTFNTIMVGMGQCQSVFELKLMYCRLASNLVFNRSADLIGMPDDILNLMSVNETEKCVVPMRKQAVKEGSS